MIQYEQKFWFWLLLLIPFCVMLFLWVLYWQRKKQKQFAESALLEKLSPNKSQLKKTIKLILFILALGLVVLALVNPKIGTKIETIRSEGIDIVFAVDVSKSMLAEDVAPNRLEKSKQLVSQIINNLGSDRVGLIAYAGKAFPQLAITTDYSAAKMFLQNLNTHMLSSQGTAIHEAIQLAKSYFDDEQQTNRLLVLISDGEDHSENSFNIANEVEEMGAKIITIGVGTEKGGPIPIKNKTANINYKKDKEGETVITKLNKEILKQIAKESNGKYIDGNQTSNVIEELKTLLEQIDKTEYEAKQIADFKDQYQWFLGLGILLIIVEVLFLDRKTAWIKRLNLFNEKK